MQSNWCLKNRVRYSVAFVDGVVFPTPEPVLLRSIDEAKHFGQVPIWNRENFPALSVMRRKDGRWGGPTIGPVLQYVKPAPKGERLECGRIAASGNYDEPLNSANNAFVKHVWAIARRLTMPVQCVDEKGRVLNTTIHTARAGLHAAAWQREKPGRFFSIGIVLFVPLAAGPTKGVSNKPASRRGRDQSGRR